MLQPRVENAVAVLCLGEKRIPLCGWSQVAILQVLCEEYPKPVQAEMIMQALWGRHGLRPSGPSNTLAAQMCKLRLRLRESGATIDRYARGSYKLILAKD